MNVSMKISLVPPSTLGVSIPEQAEMAIMVCLNIRPEHRLQSASDFMEALMASDLNQNTSRTGSSVSAHD